MSEIRKVSLPYRYDLELVHTIGTDQEVMTCHHFHNVYEIYLSLCEGAEMWIGNQCFRLGQYDLLLLAPTDFHRIIVHDRIRFNRLILYFHPQYIQSLDHIETSLLGCFGVRQGKRVHHLKLSIPEAEHLQELYSRIASLQADGSMYAKEVRKKIALAEVLIFINEILLSGKRQENPIEPSSVAHKRLISITEYIDQHFDQDLDAASVGMVFNINRHSINNLFRSHTGLSFHKYLINTRIIRAKELLANGENSVTDVCFDCGFHDYANFIRTFTQSVGISPGKFARQHQNSQV
jgi:AraC-like DNA-binding protein